MSAVWDDEPGPRHDLRCVVLARTVGACDCGADDPADLAQAGYADHVGGYPLDDPMDALLRPEAGSLADRLDRLARTLPCDGEAS